MNDSGKRIIPEGAPLSFITNRWKKHVYDDHGTINRHYYEMAVLTELRNYVRSGDVSIIGIRQHKDFDEYLISKEKWNGIEPETTRLAVSISADDYIAERTDSLLKRLDWVSNNIVDLDGIHIENGNLHIERLEKDTPEGAREFSVSLYDLLPRIKLTDLLMEEPTGLLFTSNSFMHQLIVHQTMRKQKC
jgi:hypothetical protein